MKTGEEVRRSAIYRYDSCGYAGALRSGECFPPAANAAAWHSGISAAGQTLRLSFFSLTRGGACEDKF
jgi:hypothetical protein